MAGRRVAVRAAARVVALGMALGLAPGLAPGLAAGVGAVETVAAETETAETGAAETGPAGRGPVTGLPMPRFVSLRGGEGNARRGPGMTHRIDWVFTRRNMPLRVTAEFEHWRRVEDAEGLGGWMHFALLSGVRHVLVQEDMTPLHLQADARAPVVGYMEAGVIARLQDCGPEWCRLRADSLRGWAPRAALWGVGDGEILD